MGSAPSCTAEEALERLKAGNDRFVSGRGHFPSLQKEILADLAHGQQPYATILGWSDSRVPPEVAFDAHLGELFVVRVAGNVPGAAIFGTLKTLRETPEVKAVGATSGMKLVGAVYELETGRVRFLD